MIDATRPALSLAALLLILVPPCSFAEPMYDWVATYDYPEGTFDTAEALAVGPGNRVCVTGWSHGADGESDMATILYDSQGGELWTARFDGPPGDGGSGTHVVFGPDRSICVAGRTWTTDTGADFLVVRYDSLGQQEWAITYDGPGHGTDIVTGFGIDPSGCLLVAGPSVGDTTSMDFATVKVSPAGVVLWTSRYDGPLHSADMATAGLVVDSLGYCYVGGRTGVDWDYAVAAYRPDGDEEWVAVFHPEDCAGGTPYDVALAPDRSVVLVGSNFDTVAWTHRTVTAAIAPDGHLSWLRVLNPDGPSPSQPFDVDVGSDGSIFVAGDPYLTKYDASGVEQWSVQPGFGVRALAATDEGSVIATGGGLTAASFGSDGAQTWAATYSEADCACDVAKHGPDGVVITGYLRQGGASSEFCDYVTIRYVPGTGVAPIPGAQPSVWLSAPFPNPFAQSTTISGACGALREGVSIGVYDVSGRLVTSLTPSIDDRGRISSSWCGKDSAGDKVSSGVYFVRLHGIEGTGLQRVLHIR